MRVQVVGVSFLLVVICLTSAAGQDEGEVNFGGSADEKNQEEGELEIDEDGIGAKAASRQINCLCQCSNLSYRDKSGAINGNCLTPDKTGALWCYVDPKFSRCADLQRSVRTTQAWSYEACATPDIDSQQCRFALQNGGFQNGGFSNGGLNNGGFQNGGLNNGGFQNGGLNNGGFQNGGLNNGGFQNGGLNNGGFQNGGLNNGGFQNGGFQNGGLNNGGFQNGGLNTGGRTPSGGNINNGGYQALTVDDLREANSRNAVDHQAEEDLKSAVNFGE